MPGAVGVHRSGHPGLTARGPPLTTALAAASPHPARVVAGSDGVTHLEYDLVITNSFTADTTLTELVVQDESGRELRRLQGDELRAATSKLLGPEPTVAVPASATVALIVDAPLPGPSGGAAPAAVDNQISYEVPGDAPFRTIIGATTVRGPRVPVDASAPTLRSRTPGPRRRCGDSSLTSMGGPGPARRQPVIARHRGVADART
jgi:hypothetical protein